MLATVRRLLSSSKAKAMLQELLEARTLKAEINKVRGVSEYTPDGHIISVNDNWLKALGYSEIETKNQHHSQFVPAHIQSTEQYQNMWKNLSAGNNDKGIYQLKAKDGSIVWLQGYYSPIADENGTVIKVVSYTTDITQDKLRTADFEGQIAAISKSQAIVEFSMEGKIITANQMMLDICGYDLDTLKGRNEDMLLVSSPAQKDAHRRLWENLRKGEATSGQFIRVTKSGGEIWLQANYHPIKDQNGNFNKVVMFATDITKEKTSTNDYESQLEAIERSRGVIEFDLSGHIRHANQIFLDLTGYQLNEIVGKHHSMFVDPEHSKSQEYKHFWQKLNAGEFIDARFKRFGKNNKEIWLQATYNPVLDLNGKPYKVVKFATDISKEMLQVSYLEDQLNAIHKIQGIIEFNMDGTIITANPVFLKAVDYTLEDIKGKHHSMFVDPAEHHTPEYQAFWENLRKGTTQTGRFKRIINGGKEIWIQALYAPILDLHGKPYKVVRFATYVTDQVEAERSLLKAVEESQSIIEAAKNGDLSQRVPLEGKSGNILQLCDGINALIDKMTEVVIQVKDAGETINTAANEISSGNNDLSVRTEQQASSLQETTSSMHQLAGTVKQNAENAKQANQLSAAASGVAVKGGTVVSQVITTMADINDSSRKIEDIITVIDGIAFQTNILALNAAVEAARAGEQGRGFAVVAGEVRNLAQRSAAAAKEIKQLITNSVSKVQDGTKLVEEAGQTMTEIVNSVKRVTDIMGEITAASVEQSTGIDQVNRAITSMDESTQQNSALVEEAAAAAESLVDQAANLMDVVGSFRLQRQSSTVVASVPKKSTSNPVVDAKFSFDDAKEAHVKWKTRLVNYIAGRSDEHLDINTVCRDDKCALGAWIYGPAQKHAHLAEYRELKSAHAEFHQSVGEIVACVHQHNETEARRLLGGAFSKNSSRTISAINQIESRVGASPKITPNLSRTGTDDSDWEEF